MVATLPTFAPTAAVAMRLEDQPQPTKGRTITRMTNFMAPVIRAKGK